MKIGYARVSTDDQNPALQLAALKKARCNTIFKDEGVSGTISKRPGLSRCLKKLTPGTFVTPQGPVPAEEGKEESAGTELRFD